ncbi:MAG TPA: glucan 1,4-alpha-maltotetraohydrolase domain-containing protein [Pseudomonas sp.]|jgi:alpha-amylase
MKTFPTILIGSLFSFVSVASGLAEDLHGNNPQGVRYEGGDEILLQGFHWNSARSTPQQWYDILAQHAGQIANDGFTSIWMPVPWRDESSWSDPASGTMGGGEGYFWKDFDKNSAYGSEAQLKQAANALKASGIKMIYDVVPNHMDRPHAGPALKVLLGEKTDWRDGCAQCDDGDPFMQGDVDLNTQKPEVKSMFQTEFTTLRQDYSASGLRFDFVKGYAPKTVDQWMNGFDPKGFCVGELWKAPNEYPANDWRHNASWQEALKAWSDESHCTVFDFALKERMQNGSLSEWRHGLNGNPDPAWRSIAVTFVDNHDTGYSPGKTNGQHHWALPENKRDQAYAYILTSPGTPTVYWPDMYDWPRGALLRQLMSLRHEAGIKADSPISFHTNYPGLVAKTTGSKKTLLVALSSDLKKTDVPATFSQVLEGDGGQIRVWRANPEPKSVTFRLICDQGQTQPGESVYAAGSGLELGNWDPVHAVQLSDVSQYPRWQGQITVPQNSSYEWKCIVRNERDPGVVRWQPGTNVAFTATPDGSSAGSF